METKFLESLSKKAQNTLSNLVMNVNTNEKFTCPNNCEFMDDCPFDNKDICINQVNVKKEDV